MPVQRSNSFTPRGKKKGDKLAVFDNMRQNGAGWGEALVSIFKGHQMTDEQAAICIQAYWRRYATIIHSQEERGAAITLQASFRGFKLRRENEARAAAAARVQARLMQRAPTETELEEYRAISLLQAVWRAHLARNVVSRLRDQKQSKLKRSFSWSKKTAGSKKSLPTGAKSLGKQSFPVRQSKVDGGRTDNPPPAKIRRSLSFDRFSRPWSGNISKESSTAGGSKTAAAEPKKRPPTVSKQLLFILLHRGPTGLGLELDATNTIVNIVKGGAADRQGYFMVGDTIASVDGVPLRGRLLQEVMDRSKSSYSFDVWRLRKVEPEEPAKENANKPVRRAFSFDRKKR